jgi:hypothetical protein
MSGQGYNFEVVKKWIWIAIAIVIFTAAAIGGYYGLVRPTRLRDNERAASTALKTLTSAEADFRANDRDWNHINDFWTGDVAGLYYVRPNTPKESPDIRLIDRRIAEADAKPLKPLVAAPVPYYGYYFIALDEDDTLDTAEERLYKRDTGGPTPMGKVHNESKFGFCAYPAKYGVTGRYTFIVNENNTIFRVDMKGKIMTLFPRDDRPPEYYFSR